MADCYYETDDETTLYIEDDPNHIPVAVRQQQQLQLQLQQHSNTQQQSTPSGMKLLLIHDTHLRDEEDDMISEMMESYINTYNNNDDDDDNNGKIPNDTIHSNNNNNNNNNNHNNSNNDHYNNHSTTMVPIVPPQEDPITDDEDNQNGNIHSTSIVTKGQPPNDVSTTYRILGISSSNPSSDVQQHQTKKMMSQMIRKWGICWMVVFLMVATVIGTIYMFRKYDIMTTTTTEETNSVNTGSSSSSSSSSSNNNAISFALPTSSPSLLPSVSPSMIPINHPSASPSDDIVVSEQNNSSGSSTTTTMTNSPTSTPITTPPTLIPTTLVPSSSPSTELYSTIISILRSASSTPDQFNDFTTYESQAAQWMKYNSTIPFVSNEHIMQRYTMALLDLALHTKFTMALPSVDECEWLGVTCSSSTASDVATTTSDIVPTSGNGNGSGSSGSTSSLTFQPVTSIVWNDQSMTSIQIPNDIILLSNTLRHLDVSNNHIGGTIPMGLYSCTQLQYLNVNNNALSGMIHTEMGQLSNLQQLYLNNNTFTGTVPIELGLSSLEWLSMSNNQFTGSLPSSLGWTNMVYLDLGRNQLTGTIPNDWVEMDYGMMRLNSLYLDNNLLNGTLPSTWYMLGNNTIEQIFINDNQLTGEISSSHDYPNYNLTTFMVQNNMFTRIDKEFCKQHSIYEEGSGGMLAVFNADCDICTCTDLCATYCSNR